MSILRKTCKRAKGRKHREKREAAEQFVSAPTMVISKDQERLHREKSKWSKSKEIAENQIARIDEILEKTKVALKFLIKASKEVLEELKFPQNWKKHKELDIF